MKWYPVYVQWNDGDFIFDEIQGKSHSHALENAWKNWSDATIIKVQK